MIVAAMAGVYILYRPRPAGIPPEFVSSNGRIEAIEIDIATKYARWVEQVFVREGNIVNPGQVVARMDTTELLAFVRSGFGGLEMDIEECVQRWKASHIKRCGLERNKRENSRKVLPFIDKRSLWALRDSYTTRCLKSARESFC
jgi:multidrug resistance efflux pump